MRLLDGRRAIVTGAAQGLGYAVAARFVAEGARVALVDVQAEKVAAASARLGSDTAVAHAADLAQPAEVQALVDAVVARWGGIDVLVNAAGGSGVEFVYEIETVTDAIWDRILDSNLRSTFLCCRAAAPHLRSSAYGRIVNFSSGAMLGMPPMKSSMAAKLPYATSKGAIVSLSFQLAKDLRANGVAVTALRPGFVLTEPGARASTLFYQMSEADQAAALRAMPEPPRTPDEVGWAVTYLASDAAGELSGYVIELRGKLVSTQLRVVGAVDGPLGHFAYLEPDGSA